MTQATPGPPHDADGTDPLRELSRVPADDVDLRESLAGLSRLVMGHGQSGLEGMLRHVADFAVLAIPGADGAGLTLLEQQGTDTVVSSADFVREVDAIQYGIGEGPCITAATDRCTVRSGSLSSDRQWPRFGPRVGRLGVHSALSLPLLAGDQVVGALNVYARAKNAFDDRAVELGELFAIPAAISVQNAQVLAQARRLATHLQTALTNRAVIDQAIGVLMSRTGCTPDEAIARLKVMSQADNRKLSVMAQQVLDEAVRRARARHLDT
ncbi:MAG: GAF and ANTAR domain-containing protein [Actinomycetota bacterium]|nr:GAF and ANTAR domain-containing protein [Actinomycetota bacterium]MDQ2955906.1 GAF and ANTAR domain-containing protein [Actinomycetota bacterium]